MNDRLPDYAAAIAGARAWRLAPSLWAKMEGLLWSTAMLHAWPDAGEAVARCDMGHPAPAKHCSCGVYAWNDPDTMYDRGYAPKHHTDIAGVVAGAGRVIRGHIGYWVAERAVVLAFFDDGYPSPEPIEILPGSNIYLATKEEAAEVFDVPVIRYEDYDDFCDEYGLIRHGRR